MKLKNPGMWAMMLANLGEMFAQTDAQRHSAQTAREQAQGMLEEEYRSDMAKAAKKQENAGLGGALGGAVGSLLGPLGGPIGAYAGSQLAGGSGSMAKRAALSTLPGIVQDHGAGLMEKGKEFITSRTASQAAQGLDMRPSSSPLGVGEQLHRGGPLNIDKDELYYKRGRQ